MRPLLNTFSRSDVYFSDHEASFYLYCTMFKAEIEPF